MEIQTIIEVEVGELMPFHSLLNNLLQFSPKNRLDRIEDF